jgi:bifunctional ADP-heptose synthase (sugar kinase/adenylyltransferase)
MANAYTGWVQHDRHATKFGKRQISVNQQLFGVDIERSDEAVAYALAMD